MTRAADGDSGFRHDAFAGRVVLVVGATSGIGAGIAAAFAAHGAQVIATGGTDAEVDAARAEPAAATAGAAIDVRGLDVRDDAAVQALIGALPSLDVLVNCAGIIRRGDEHRPEVFAAVLDINLNGTLRTCSAARPLLARSGGCIVNTASMLSFFGGGLVPAYSASKGGVAQLTKSLAVAYADDGIRVNAVAPGWIVTPLTAALHEDPARSGAILGRTPLKRWGRPDDVGLAVLFLASPAARFVTGVILPVDGGYLVA